jgi:hypothetical protein
MVYRENESYQTCLDTFVFVKTETLSNVLPFLVGLCSTWLTVTDVSARHCVRVEEERLHYLTVFLYCYCVEHVKHRTAVIHLVLKPEGTLDPSSQAARCKLPRCVIIAAESITQADYKLCMSQRTTLSFCITPPPPPFCYCGTAVFPLLP